MLYYIKSSSMNLIRKKCDLNCSCCYFLFEKKTVNPSVQCHVLAQSLPGRIPDDKYPFNTSHRSRLCKDVPLAVLFGSNSNTHIIHSLETLVGQKRNWHSSKCCTP